MTAILALAWRSYIHKETEEDRPAIFLAA
jgi:hypothetical protein